jgi:dTMP kinase
MRITNTGMEDFVGRLIEICGIDGSGKSTQATLLANSLRSRGENVACFNTPTGTPVGDAAMRDFQRTGSAGISFEALALNSAASRTIQYESEVLPFIESGGNAIYTRYVNSIRYYFEARGADTDFVRTVHAHLPQPTHAILLRIDISEAMIRMVDRGLPLDFEERSHDYLAGIQRRMIDEWPTDNPIVDAMLPSPVIAEEILAYVTSWNDAQYCQK